MARDALEAVRDRLEGRDPPRVAVPSQPQAEVAPARSDVEDDVDAESPEQAIEVQPEHVGLREAGPHDLEASAAQEVPDLELQIFE